MAWAAGRWPDEGYFCYPYNPFIGTLDHGANHSRRLPAERTQSIQPGVVGRETRQAPGQRGRSHRGMGKRQADCGGAARDRPRKYHARDFGRDRRAGAAAGERARHPVGFPRAATRPRGLNKTGLTQERRWTMRLPYSVSYLVEDAPPGLVSSWTNSKPICRLLKSSGCAKLMNSGRKSIAARSAFRANPT